MINIKDVINFIDNLIYKRIDFNTCCYPKIYRIGFYDKDGYYITIILYTEENYIDINFPKTNKIRITNISKIDILDLQRAFIAAEECSKAASEYKFRHYFDKINEVDKTIDNLDDDED